MLYAFLQGALSINPRLEFRVLRGEDLPQLPENARQSTTFVPATIPALVRNLFGSDAFAVVGGTHLTDFGLNRRTIAMVGRIALLVGFSKLLRKKVYFIAAGLGPFRRYATALVARLICERADAISVRDQTSLEVSKKLGVGEKTTSGFDVAALADWRRGVPSRAETDTCHTLGISITPVFTLYHDDEKSDRDLAKSIGEAVSTWMRAHPDWQVRLFAFHGQSNWTTDDDVRITNELQKSIRPKERVQVIEYQSNPVEMFRRVSECSAFVAMKYHACLFAYLSEIPLLIIPYHPKCAALAREIGLPDEALITLDGVLDGQLEEHIESLTSMEGRMNARLPVFVAESRALAAVNLLAKVGDG